MLRSPCYFTQYPELMTRTLAGKLKVSPSGSAQQILMLEIQRLRLLKWAWSSWRKCISVYRLRKSENQHCDNVQSLLGVIYM